MVDLFGMNISGGGSSGIFENIITENLVRNNKISDLASNTSTAVELATQWLTATANITIDTTTNRILTNVSQILESQENLQYHNNDNKDFNFYNYEDVELDKCDPNNGNFNCSREQFLIFARGPQRLPLATALLITVIFGGIFITGVIGNVLVCIVIVRQSTMHTATNYYLFSLAVSDLIFLLFGLPYEISLYWHQYPYSFGLAFCKIRALISEASTYVSVLTIVAFSMERFLAICHPLHLYAMSGFKRAIRIIAALWIISFMSAIPFCVFTTIDYVKYPPDYSTIEESAFCAMLDNPKGFPLWEFSTCLFFIIPMVVILILYGRMGMQIRSRTTQQLGVQHGSMHRESRHQQSRKAVIRMLAAVVITFFICWAPFHAQRLLYLYAKQWDRYPDINEWLFSIAGFSYYVSCTINPILYNVMSHRYRVAFKETLCGKRRSFYYSNGFARDHSSFRNTTIGSHIFDRTQSVRVRSMRHTSFRERDSFTSNSSTWTRRSDNTKPFQSEITDDRNPHSTATNLLVVVDRGVNGRPKVYTDTDAQDNLITNNETRI